MCHCREQGRDRQHIDMSIQYAARAAAAAPTSALLPLTRLPLDVRVVLLEFLLFFVQFLLEVFKLLLILFLFFF
jgi:hypothetical protein